MAKNWIKGAVKPGDKGKFKAKAEKAGESTAAFADEHAGDSGKLGREARLAKTLMSMHKKAKGGSPTSMRNKLYGSD